MIRLDQNIVSNFDEAYGREWLETNGIGGFSSGTVSGANSRRYHGLLNAATNPPLGRMVLLSKFEETLILDGKRHDLSTNKYPGKIFPKGFEFLTSFRLDPFPIWEYDIGGIKIEKTVFMPRNANAVVCRWKASGKVDGLSLELRPLIAFRDHHHLRTGTDHFSFRNIGGGLVSIEAAGEAPTLFLSHNGGELVTTGEWYRNFEYAIEEERGFDFRENLFQPFMLRCNLDEAIDVIASTEGIPSDEARNLETAEAERRADLVSAANAGDEFEKQLVLAADQFIVKRGEGSTVIAGYPWFSDWGRDTMIALPGLALTTNRPEIARSIIREFARHISMGMIPNRFPDEGEQPDYNTVDATLWYFEAIRAYVDATGDIEFVREELWEKLADIVSWHLRGTRHGIRVDTDGLLHAGESGTQLTWMDAKCGDEVFTPRTGKPVEIQALWYNALRIMETFAASFGDPEKAEHYRATAAMARRSFNGIFWNEDEGCLFDVIEDGFRDRSIRPNQIFSVSLRHPILEDEERRRKVVERVEADLLTPFGLRSLAASDPRYHGVYKGSPYERDSSYHQGPVWGWLIGPFIDAYIKVFPERHSECSAILTRFNDHMLDAGVGQISEMFDGDFPHTPRGCPAQAWSTAEVLRSYKTLADFGS